MKHIPNSLLILFVLSQIIVSNAQDFSIDWALSIEGGFEKDEYVNDLTIDKSNNIIMTGFTFQTTSIDFDFVGDDPITADASYNIFLAKYKNDGTYLWAFLIGNTGNDISYDVITDDNNNIYICGEYAGTVDFDPSANTANLTSSNNRDIYVASYDADGNYRWAFSLDIKSMGNFIGDLAFDGNNIVITGSIDDDADFDPGAGTVMLDDNKAFIAKYTTNGDFVSAVDFGDSKTDPFGLTIDKSGNIYITGKFSGDDDFNDDGTIDVSGTHYTLGVSYGYETFFAKFKPDLGLIWAKALNGDPTATYTGSAKGVDIVTDTDGNVYVTGIINGPTDFDPNAGSYMSSSSTFIDTEFFLAKYNTSGALQWAFSAGHSYQDNNSEEVYNIDIAPDNTLLLSGGYASMDHSTLPSFYVDFDPLNGGDQRESYGPGHWSGFMATYNTSGGLINMTNVGGEYGTSSSFRNDNFSRFDLNMDIVGAGAYQTAGNVTDMDPSSAVVPLPAPDGNSDMYLLKFGPTSTLPINLINFDAKKISQNVEISWTTQTEINNDYFTIEKSLDGENFTAILTEEGAGNSSKIIKYKAIDYEQLNETVYYRLKQTDFDNTFTYSKTVSVSQLVDKDRYQLYPNPANTFVQVKSNKLEGKNIQISDYTGKIVKHNKIISNNTRIDISDLDEGIYFIKIGANTQKLIKY